MAALIVQSGKHKGKKITLPTQEVIIGRGEDCFIRLASEDVSRHHCSMIPTSRGILVHDLSSQNGTLVNTVPIETEVYMQPGDLLQVGPILFQLAGQRPKPSLVDDEVAGWLTDSDTRTELPTSHDTTIVKASQLRDANHPSEPRPTFHSVAEEARDIIRHWQEMQTKSPQS